jgi:ubiquinone/menaquinone biosynthesis C-methylase UbiE
MKLNTFEYWLMNNPIRRLVQLKVIIIDFFKYGRSIKGKRILEIGCGNGKGTVMINKYFNPSTIDAVDIDRSMIVKAKRVVAENVKLKVGSATNLKYKNNSFDGIFDFSIIHHISNWKEALKEVRRVLIRGGMVFIEEMSIESFQSIITKPLRRHLNHPYGSMYTKRQFVDFLKSIGFEIKNYRSHNFLGILKYFSLVAIKR